MFIPTARIERLAADLWRQYDLSPGFDVEDLIDRLDLGLLWDEIDDQDGGRILGQLIPARRLIMLNERHLEMLSRDGGRLERYTVGHEIGHWILHASAGGPLFERGATWCRDGSASSLERQAELFSAALLMPEGPVRLEFQKVTWSGWSTVYRLADTFLVNRTPMVIRLEELGWIHRAAGGRPELGRAPVAGQLRLI